MNFNVYPCCPVGEFAFRSVFIVVSVHFRFNFRVENNEIVIGFDVIIRGNYNGITMRLDGSTAFGRFDCFTRNWIRNRWRRFGHLNDGDSRIRQELAGFSIVEMFEI